MLKFKINRDGYHKLRVVRYDDSELVPFNFESIVEFIRNNIDLKIDQDSFRVCSVFMFFRYLDKRTIYARNISS